jgi:predicted aspartyl protease
MTQHPFDPREDLLRFSCDVQHGHNHARLLMALDTGAAWIMVAEAKLTALSYDFANVTDTIVFGDASQSHTVSYVTLDSFGVVGAEESNIECLAYTPPADYGIDGLIGLNYLRRFRHVNLNFEDGVLTLEK